MHPPAPRQISLMPTSPRFVRPLLGTPLLECFAGYITVDRDDPARPGCNGIYCVQCYVRRSATQALGQMGDRGAEAATPRTGLRPGRVLSLLRLCVRPQGQAFNPSRWWC